MEDIPWLIPSTVQTLLTPAATTFAAVPVKRFPPTVYVRVVVDGVTLKVNGEFG